MNSRLFTITALLFTFLSTSAQFNDRLEEEILALDKQYNLSTIEKKDALNLLEEIRPNMDQAEVRKHLIGEPWKYSHSVSSKGRKYRQSNSTYILHFSEGGKSYYKQKDGAKTYCTWDDERSDLLEVDRFETDKREKRTRRDYLGIHFISQDRLVLTKVIKSKETPGKSAVLFVVYFRR